MVGTEVRKGHLDTVVEDIVDRGFGLGMGCHMGSTVGDTRNPLLVNHPRAHVVDLEVTQVVGHLVLEDTDVADDDVAVAVAVGILGTDSLGDHCRHSHHYHPSTLKKHVVCAFAEMSLHLATHLVIWGVFGTDLSILQLEERVVCAFAGVSLHLALHLAIW